MIGIPQSSSVEAAPHRTQTLSLFVRKGQISRCAIGSALAALLLAPLYRDDSLWLGAGVFLALFVAWHGMVATKQVPWMPGFIAAIACVQWILAPWAAYHLPVLPTAIAQVLTPSEYFSYAVPATCALTAGLFLSLIPAGRNAAPRTLGAIDKRRLIRTLDAMVVLGVFSRLALAPLAGGSLRFVVALVSQLAWVGAFGAMLVEAPAWRLRIVALLLIEAILGAAQGMFAELVLWSIYLMLLYLFARRVRRSRIAMLAALAVFAVFTLNAIKKSFREEIFGSNLSALERGALAAEYIGGMVRNPSQVVAPENISFNITRLNQGAIIGRVMYWTPLREPFADGETINTAVVASLLPRAFAPDKLIAGGFANYPRFTGLPLYGGTSINLSVAGEMYANYGYSGGITGMFIVGVVVGSLFAVFVRWSRGSVLWWAWLPYIMGSVVSAEGGIGETLNQMVKSAVVVFAIVIFVPAWDALRPRVARRRARAMATPARRA